MLGAELTLAGVDVAIVERRANQDLDGSRAAVFSRAPSRCSISAASRNDSSPRGRSTRALGFAGIFMDLSDFPSRHNYTLGLTQIHIERLLAEWVLDELKVPIYREREVTGFAQDDAGVNVEVSDGSSLRAEYLVGCDGGRSVIRKAAGIDFVGWDATTRFIIAEVEMKEEPPIGMRPEGGGIGPANPAASGGPYRDGVDGTRDRAHQRRRPWTISVRYSSPSSGRTSACTARPGSHASPTCAGRRRRTAPAECYSPATPPTFTHPHGGQGLSTGVQDAVNLGWKLAQVVKGTSPESLLDTYHAERHPVGARVLHNTMAQVALSNGDERHVGAEGHRHRTAGHGRAAPAHRRDALARSTSTTTSARGTRCSGGACPTSTCRPPTVRRAYSRYCTTRWPVLLNFGEPGGFDVSAWDRVRLVNATYDGVWELPVLGEVAAPPAVLIRPDGHVAWVGELTDPTLPNALTTWF